MTRPNRPLIHQPLSGATDYAVAHRWLWQQGRWKFLLWPFLCSVLLLPFYLSGVWQGSHALTAWGMQLLHLDINSFWYWVGWPVMLVLMLWVGYVLLKQVLMILCLPVHMVLSDRILAEQLGDTATNPTGSAWHEWPSRLVRTLGMTLMGIALGLLASVLLLLCAMLPFVGAFLAIGLGLLLQSFLAAWGFFDPVYERAGFGVGQSLRRSLQQAPLLVSSGLPFVLMFQVPVLGWTLAPIYGTVAGAHTACQWAKREQWPT